MNDKQQLAAMGEHIDSHAFSDSRAMAGLREYERAALGRPHPNDFGIPAKHWDAARYYAEYMIENASKQVRLAPSFKIGDRVRKTKGSRWQGNVVGTYSTSMTQEGYAVESETEHGSVQIYPVSALELVK